MLPRFLDRGGWSRVWPSSDMCDEALVSTAAGGQPINECLRSQWGFPATCAAAEACGNSNSKSKLRFNIE